MTKTYYALGQAPVVRSVLVLWLCLCQQLSCGFVIHNANHPRKFAACASAKDDDTGTAASTYVGDEGVACIQAALGKMKYVMEDPNAFGEQPLAKLYKRCVDAVEVRPSSIAGAGMGLFARKAMKSGTLFSFYPAHGLGVDLDESSQCFALDEKDQDFFDTADAKPDNYLHYLMGSRPLINCGTTGDDGAFQGHPLFIDINPNKPTQPAWKSHYVNDGACVAANSSEEGVLAYYAETKQSKNCVHVPFGPSPLLASVTTKKVKKGQELFTSYGCSYWLDELTKGGEQDCTEITQAILQQVQGSARDLLTAMQRVEMTHEKEAIALKEIFEQQ